MPAKFFKNVSGFTLVELLVVMAIIGVLATILLSSFIGVRERARDGRRKSDVAQIQAALEQYRSDQGGYPAVQASPFYLNGIVCGGAFTNVGATATYMQSIPCDPLGSGMNFNTGNYYYTSDGTNYTIAGCMENGSDSDTRIIACPAGVGSCPTSKCYTVYNP